MRQTSVSFIKHFYIVFLFVTFNLKVGQASYQLKTILVDHTQDGSQNLRTDGANKIDDAKKIDDMWGRVVKSSRMSSNSGGRSLVGNPTYVMANQLAAEVQIENQNGRFKKSVTDFENTLKKRDEKLTEIVQVIHVWPMKGEWPVRGEKFRDQLPDNFETLSKDDKLRAMKAAMADFNIVSKSKTKDNHYNRNTYQVIGSKIKLPVDVMLSGAAQRIENALPVSDGSVIQNFPGVARTTAEIAAEVFSPVPTAKVVGAMKSISVGNKLLYGLKQVYRVVKSKLKSVAARSIGQGTVTLAGGVTIASQMVACGGDGGEAISPPQIENQNSGLNLQNTSCDITVSWDLIDNSTGIAAGRAEAIAYQVYIRQYPGTGDFVPFSGPGGRVNHPQNTTQITVEPGQWEIYVTSVGYSSNRSTGEYNRDANGNIIEIQSPPSSSVGINATR